MFNRNTLYALVKIKDTTGRYIWQDGTLPTLFAKPYTLNDDMPDIGAGKASVLFEDFSKFKIRMVKDFRVIRLNELLAEYLSIGISGFARLDGLQLNPCYHISSSCVSCSFARPSSKATIRSAFITVLSSWATTKTIRPLTSVSMAYGTSTSFFGSSDAVASPSRMIGASFNMTRVVDMRCFSVPDNVQPPSSTIVSYPCGNHMMKS